jgi:anti-sigma B factor antagonist
MTDQDFVGARTDPVVVKLPAEIDATCAAQVGMELAFAFSPGTRAVIADLTETSFCDSAGVRMLVVSCGQAAENGTKLALVAPTGAVRRVFDLVDIGSLVPVYASLDAAVSGLRAG